MELLKDLTVLSLEQATVLPYLTFRLAQDGMNVIRLEHPVYGDPNRFIGDNVLSEERMNAYFLCINAGKKALTLNLAEDEGRKIFHSLIKELNIGHSIIAFAAFEGMDHAIKKMMMLMSMIHY